MDRGYALFKTALGACGIAWGPRGITAVELSEASDRLPIALKPPRWVERVIQKVRRHLAGKPQDLSDVRLDLDGVPPFHRRVYRVARAVGPGRTVTYGALAAQAGSPGASRAVGQAMARNPFLLVVPCHRVLGSGHELVGFSARGGCATKARLLALEGLEMEGKLPSR